MHEDKKQIPTSYRSLKTIVLGEYGIPCQDASMVLMDVPLDRLEVRKILPLGLWPTNPPMATMFVANYPVISGSDQGRGEHRRYPPHPVAIQVAIRYLYKFNGDRI